MEIYTSDEKRSLLYYQGAGDKIQLESWEADLKDFYQINNSYETINMLLFPGIDNEISRLMTEEREIDSLILDFLPELLKVYGNLYSAICKYTYLQPETKSGENSISDENGMDTYRDDRWHTYLCMESGINPSFLSTTKKERSFTEGDSGSCFQKKDGLVLLDCCSLKTIEHLDMNEVLGEDSIYPEEEEILFPPFLYCDLAYLNMSDSENELKDIHGNPPRGKFKLILNGSTIEAKSPHEISESLDDLRKNVLDSEAIQNAKTVWEKLKKKETPSTSEIQQYTYWKLHFQNYLRGYFSVIKWQVRFEDRQVYFYSDLQERIKDANTHRERYEIQLKIFHISVIILCGLAGLLFALALITDLAEWIPIYKIIGLTLTTAGIVLFRICKSLSLEEKLEQRTTTFLRLDELKMDYDYEKPQTVERLNDYIDNLKQIVLNDNRMCELYTKNAVKHLDELSKELMEKRLKD